MSITFISVHFKTITCAQAKSTAALQLYFDGLCLKFTLKKPNKQFGRQIANTAHR